MMKIRSCNRIQLLQPLNKPVQNMLRRRSDRDTARRNSDDRCTAIKLENFEPEPVETAPDWRKMLLVEQTYFSGPSSTQRFDIIFHFVDGFEWTTHFHYHQFSRFYLGALAF